MIITNILIFRKIVREIYQRYQKIFDFVFKFFLTFIAYNELTKAINYASVMNKGIIKVGFGLAGAILPLIVTTLLFMLVTVYEIYVASPLLALLLLIIMIVLYCFAARFSGKCAYALVAIPLLMRVNLHYFIPMFMGLTAGPMAIFPAAVGVILYYVMGVMNGVAADAKISTADDALATYLKVLDGIMSNKQMVYTIVAFAVVIIVMWLVKKLKYEFVMELDILTGCLTMLNCYFISVLKFNMIADMGKIIVGTILSTLILFVVQFFMLLLNYTKAQNLQFQDDEYYYYVKAVPKIDVEIPDRFVKFMTLKEKKRQEEAQREESKSISDAVSKIMDDEEQYMDNGFDFNDSELVGEADDYSGDNQESKDEKVGEEK